MSEIALAPVMPSMPDKKSKADVHYSIGKQCANCVYFVRFEHGGMCELVAGEIKPEGVCDLWTQRAGKGSFDYTKEFYETEYKNTTGAMFSSHK